MVMLTTPYIVRKLCQQSGQSEENEKKNLKRLTHLRLQDCFIDSIGEILSCKRLTVLYLQNNALTKIENLDHAVHLTNLYLQKNKIMKIENLSTLKKLRKLYLSHNCISVIEGLDQLCSLEELQVQKQELPAGESLYFDPRTINGLSRSLRILNTSDNQLTSLVDLEGLLELESLSACNNKLSDIDETATVVSKWQYLIKLELKGNPICSQQKYREKIIVKTHCLGVLDGKVINENTRNFLKNFEKCKLEQQNMPQRILNLPPDVADLAKNFNPGIKKLIIESVLKDNEALKSSESEDQSCPNSMFPAWKAEFEPLTPVNLKIPRPFWRQVNAARFKIKSRPEHEVQRYVISDRPSKSFSAAQIH